VRSFLACNDGSVTPAPPSVRDPLTDSERKWLRVREFLDDKRFGLGRGAARLYPDHPTVGPTPLLTARRWMPAAPVRLSDLTLDLEPNRAVRESFTDAATAVVLPERSDGARYESYSAALTELTGRTFDNRGTYRLQAAHLRGVGRLAFGLGRYFDGLDVGEAAAHEFAAVRLGLLADDEQRIRRAIGDPCDPARRPTNVAISTLSLRHDRTTRETTCLLHWRDPNKVGHAGGLYQVLPTGVFQAAGGPGWNLRNDFDLWRSMIREYAEELLGADEGYGAERAPIDYAAWPFAAAMARGLADGAIRAYVLGLGVDALTLATDLLTVVVIDAGLYDELFDRVIAVNQEGRVLSSVDEHRTSAYGIPFTADMVSRFTEDEPMQAAGAAVLWSAWEQRAALLD
jgi:hypothetical protein